MPPMCLPLPSSITRGAALLLLREGRARHVWPAAGANGAPAVAETGAASASEAYGAGCSPLHLADLSQALCIRRFETGAKRLLCHSISVGSVPALLAPTGCIILEPLR